MTRRSSRQKRKGGKLIVMTKELMRWNVCMYVCDFARILFIFSVLEENKLSRYFWLFVGCCARARFQKNNY